MKERKAEASLRSSGDEIEGIVTDKDFALRGVSQTLPFSEQPCCGYLLCLSLSILFHNLFVFLLVFLLWSVCVVFYFYFVALLLSLIYECVMFFRRQ